MSGVGEAAVRAAQASAKQTFQVKVVAGEASIERRLEFEAANLAEAVEITREQVKSGDVLIEKEGRRLGVIHILDHHHWWFGPA